MSFPPLNFGQYKFYINQHDSYLCGVNLLGVGVYHGLIKTSFLIGWQVSAKATHAEASNMALVDR